MPLREIIDATTSAVAADPKNAAHCPVLDIFRHPVPVERQFDAV
jgi:hypothetical protein